MQSSDAFLRGFVLVHVMSRNEATLTNRSYRRGHVGERNFNARRASGQEPLLLVEGNHSAVKGIGGYAVVASTTMPSMYGVGSVYCNHDSEP